MVGVAFLLLYSCSLDAGEKTGPDRPLPVIDMHLHAREAVVPPRALCLPVTASFDAKPQCHEPLLSPASDEEMVRDTVAILDRLNIFGVISGNSLETIRRFLEAAEQSLSDVAKT